LGGTILNIITVFIGSALGMLIGSRLNQRMQESVVTGLGIITFIVGLQNAFTTGNMIIPLLATVLGVIIGEVLRIDLALESLAAWLQKRFGGGDSASTPENPETLNPRERFITGFVTASLVFCVGPLTFVGSIQDGMGLAVGFQALAIKSVLDGFAAMAFAASFGLGVMFTIVTIVLIQGGLALLGMFLLQVMNDPALSSSLSSNPMIVEMTAVGGVLLIALSLILLDIKKPRVANFLPAVLLAPLMVWLAPMLGINIYPL
jgi:uncharacterized membrane protein YqgA involved in biofilm formation